MLWEAKLNTCVPEPLQGHACQASACRAYERRLRGRGRYCTYAVCVPASCVPNFPHYPCAQGGGSAYASGWGFYCPDGAGHTFLRPMLTTPDLTPLATPERTPAATLDLTLTLTLAYPEP